MNLVGIALLWGLVACRETESASKPALIDSDDDCIACHDQVAAQWQDSRHHRAFTNADFQSSYAREPRPFCRNCHAPAVVHEPSWSASRAEAAGVGCRDCHGRGDVVHTGPGAADNAPHPLKRREDFGTRACASCHEFTFPEDSPRPQGTMMQTTMREHAASPFASQTCASCHLKGADHSFSSTRDPQAWRDALGVEVRREAEAVVFVLTPRGIGHAFPTGDLFRRVALHVEQREGQEVLREQTRYLARHFEPQRLPSGRINGAYVWPVHDDRPHGLTEVRMPVDGRGEVSWSVVYERVDARDDAEPETSTIASEILLDHGQLDGL